MKVLFDTNILLDAYLARVPHLNIAERLLDAVSRSEIQGILCATTLTTINCLASKLVGASQAKKQVRQLLARFDVALVNHDVLSQALDSGFPDYEDAVLHEAARAARVDVIVTRNRKDFSRATLRVLSPEELWSVLARGKV